MAETASLIPAELIEKNILWLRDQKVMLDMHLSILYGVETRSLIQAVKRNIERFPEDFMFQLNTEEVDILRSQNVISNIKGRGGRRYAPYGFSEQGVAMLSSVLRSKQAISVNIEIMRAFVQLRRLLGSNAGFAKKIEAVEQRYDEQFSVVFKAIKQLMSPVQHKKKRPIGFMPWNEHESETEQG